jgi:hypothetical protein
MGKLITINRYIEELTIEIHPLWGPQWVSQDTTMSTLKEENKGESNLPRRRHRRT